MNRFGSWLLFASTALATNACNARPPAPDVQFTDDVGFDDTMVTPTDHFVRETGGTDATLMDVFMPDTGTLPDAQLPDVVIANAGPCHATTAPAVIVSETRQLARPVFVNADSDGIDITVAGQNAGGPEAIWFLSAGADGTLLNAGAVTPTPMGAHVTGGGFAPAIEIYAVAYTSDETGAAQVYVTAAQSNARPIPTTRHMVSTATLPLDSADLTLRTGGYLVAWRSHEAGGARVAVQPVDNGFTMAGPANFATESGFDVDSFRIVSSVTDATYAVAYVGVHGGTREVRVAFMDVAGTLGSSILVASGADVGIDVDAVVSGANVAVVWTQGATPSVAIQIVSGGADAGTAGTPVVLSALPGPAASAGIARDGADYAVGYRSGTGDATRLVLARIRADRTVHDVSVLAGSASGGRVGVGVAAGGHYGIGSADDFMTGTIARLTVALCPP